MSPYTITETMLNLVQEISAYVTKLSLEKRELHLRKENRIRSIQSSLAIENNSLSLEQVTDIIEGRRVLGPPKDIHEVQNAYEAYEHAFRLNPYAVNDFLLAHGLLTQGLVKSPGQFRSGDLGVFDGQGQVVHVGARPQFVPNLLADLFDWARDSQVSMLVKSSIVHFELEMIHPFEDGNGRMGRLWQSLLLSQWNPIFEWLPIESVIYHHQQGYYAALSQSNDANDSTVFIEFMLSAILETLQMYSLKNSLTKMSELMSEKEATIFNLVSTYLTQHDGITSRQLQELAGVSSATARRYLVKFVELGLLRATGQTKSRHYYLASGNET